jgi:hypothetical protein
VPIGQKLSDDIARRPAIRVFAIYGANKQIRID